MRLGKSALTTVGTNLAAPQPSSGQRVNEDMVAALASLERDAALMLRVRDGDEAVSRIYSSGTAPR